MRMTRLLVGAALLLGAVTPGREARARGYRPLSRSKVAIWDTNKLYTRKSPTREALKDRARWTLVPYARSEWGATTCPGAISSSRTTTSTSSSSPTRKTPRT